MSADVMRVLSPSEAWLRQVLLEAVLAPDRPWLDHRNEVTP